MAIGNGVVIRFFADTAGAVASIGKLEDAVGRTTTSHERWNATSGKMVAAMAAVGAAVGAVAIKLGVDGVKAAMDDEAAMAKLSTQMKNMGFEPFIDSTNEAIGAMQAQYGVSEDLLRPAFARLLSSTNDVAKAQNLLKLGMDISQATGKDLNTVVQGLGRAYDGNTGALGRLGLGIDKATLKSGDLDAITDILSQRFGGSAQANANTFKGALNRVELQAGELKEAFGRGLINALGNVGKASDTLIDIMADFEPVIEGVGSAFGTLASTALKSYTDAVIEAGDESVNSRKKISGLGLAAQIVGALIGEIGGSLTGPNSPLGLAAQGLGSLPGATNAATSSFNSNTDAINKNAMAAARTAQARRAALAAQLAAAQAEDDDTDAKDRNTKATDSATQKAEELRIKWMQVATDIAASVDILDVSITGKAVKVSGNLVKAFEDRKNAFKAVVDEQSAIIESAYKAIQDYSDNVVKSFTEFKLGDFIKVEEDGSVNFLADAFNKWISDKTAIANSLAPLATILPESLTQQVLGMDPSAAKAMIDYFTANPAAAETLSTNLNGLTETTRTLLADPMANVFATIGNKSAVSMIANAKKVIADEAEAFQRWVRSHLKSRVTVEVEYVAINTPPVGARAAGGPVDARKPYIVGERGPELFMPNVSGTIVPNHELPMVSGGGSAVGGQGGGASYTINVQAGVGDPRAIGQQVVEYIKKFEKANGSVFVAA